MRAGREGAPAAGDTCGVSLADRIGPGGVGSVIDRK
jgi:hypothetical protein